MTQPPDAANIAPSTHPARTGAGAGGALASDRLRRKLRDLMELAHKAAALEPVIESEFRLAMQAIEEKQSGSLEALENSLRHAHEQCEATYNTAVAGQAAAHEAAVKASEEEMRLARKRIAREFDTIQETIKKKLADAVWLADIELDALKNRQAKELHEIQEANAAKIAGKRDHADALLRKYGHISQAEDAALGEPAPLAISTDDRAALQTTYDQYVHEVNAKLEALDAVGLGRFFAGVGPWVLFIAVVLVAAGGSQILPGEQIPDLNMLGLAGGGAVLVMSALLLLLRWMARKAVRKAYKPLHEAMFYAAATGKALSAANKAWHDKTVGEAREKHKNEIQQQREKAAPLQEKAKANRDAALETVAAEAKTRLEQINRRDAACRAEAIQARESQLSQIQRKYEAEQARIISTAAARRQDTQAGYGRERAELEKLWSDGITAFRQPVSLGTTAANVEAGNPDWKAPTHFPDAVRFGEMYVDVGKIVAEADPQGSFTLEIPPPISIDALLEFPHRGSLMIHADRNGRAAALASLQACMTRLLTSIPPGRVRFTLIDPVGLGQNFAGFMHLTDYDEALVNSRIWTSPEQIDQRLADLTEHMETVIQKYLRNEYETIDDYNRQAGDLAEPYRFLVIADLPTGFSDESLKRLSSIATTGARCGVFTLVFRDTRVAAAAGTHLDDLEAHSTNLVFQDEHFIWRDDIFSRFPLTLDTAPDEDHLTRVLHQVGEKAKLAKRVEVAFSAIAPAAAEFWSRRADRDLQAPIGRCGATRLQTFLLGRGVAQHALVTGKTGSGKSTLLHALISNLSMWYSPAELELYLIDFKKGVEFKTYASHDLPHARAIGVESDREFGLSVLQRIDAEMSRRGELFRAQGVQDLASYREAAGKSLPRTLLIVDEFQEFFSEDDKLGQDAALLLDRLVRQGRAFGVHVVLGSQTIAGSSGLSRSTIGQVAVRIALQTTEADSQAVLADGNSAARLLSRPGEAIYNDAGGLVEGNSPFQVAWLPDNQRDEYLDAVTQRHRTSGIAAPSAIVFEGNIPADIRKNPRLAAALDDRRIAVSPKIWLGEPVAIKEPTAVTFRRQSGSNVLLIGQAEEQALAIMAAGIVSLAGQQPAETAFYILDGSATDSPSCGVLATVAGMTPQHRKNVEYRNVPEAMNELAEELKRRQDDTAGNAPSIFVFILGLQRYRVLRKSEESFGFGGGDEQAAPDPGKQFAELLTEGPAVGIHVLAWVDTMVSAERAINRNLMREFDNRILFQMSAADSSNLIDSPAANRLGACRALAYSEEQGTLEKFRPYAMPDAAFLTEALGGLASAEK